MNTNLKKVLVTGARAPVALHLCRILKESGMEVFAADSISYALAKTSNSINDFFLLPSPKKNSSEYIFSLLNIIQTNQIDILIPTCEESFYISMHKEKLSIYCEVLVGDFDKMELLHNKYDFIEYVNSLGFKTPKTLKLTKNNTKEDINEFFKDQLVLKRIFSRFSDKVLFLHKNEFVSLPTMIDSTWIAQERIEGNQYCSYGVAKHGKLLAHSVYKTEFTAGIGATISFSYTERKDIELFVKAIVENLNFTGQISFDFIVNSENIAIPIECNPRATSGLHLFDKNLITCLNGKNTDTLYPDFSTKEAITLALIAYSIDNWKLNKPFSKWLKTLLTHRDITFRLTDISPFFYQFVSMFLLWKDSKKNNLTMTEQSTLDISWDGEIT
ncbi:ATP-grasp domain-containing protein [Neobacillus sp.]|uniref:ATP-grasp domain-containing protein n=1 Tax=Neobacillus sp. TaxID=2675273 RepID=UPI00289BB3A6|nr:ATP-grasp domain-containing protein [Neobacillus sp.]